MRARFVYIILLALLVPGLVLTVVHASKGVHHGLPVVMSSNTASTVLAAPPESVNCSLPDGALGPSLLKMTGRCTANFTQQFQCKANIDDLYITTNAKNSEGTEFYLEINVESFTGPGDYPVTETNLLTASVAGYPRWSGTAAAHVNADNSVTFSKVDLEPVPGTGSTDTVTVEGYVGCSMS